ncbi:MAG: plasmid mobilization protein [Aeromonas sp.]
MPNQRDKSKKIVGFFATIEEKEMIQQAAKRHGYTVAGFLRAIATGELTLSTPRPTSLTRGAKRGK